MRIGIAYDIKEDYGFHKEDWSFADFVTMTGITSIKRAMERCGYTAEFIGNAEKVNNLIKTNTLAYDIIFNSIEGLKNRNREGWIPSLLENNNIPYCGSDAYALSLSLNKAHTKILAKHLGIPTPDFIEINSIDDINSNSSLFEFPLIVKPNCEGSSMGVNIIYNLNELYSISEKLLSKYGQTILSEKYIAGRELTVPVIGNGNSAYAMGIIETVTKSNEPIEVLTTEIKFSEDCKRIDSILPIHIEEIIKKYSVKIFNYFEGRDYGRVDFRLSKDNVPYFLEINLLPDIDIDSTFSKCAKYKNIEYHKLVDKIIRCALKRNNIVIK